MIALVFDNLARLSDLVRTSDKNIGTDASLEPAVFISLFTRRRAEPDDVLPEPLGDRGGYWADPYADIEGDLLGSRLWLLSRSKTTQSTLNDAKIYAEEALQWLVEDGVAESVDVVVERQADTRLAFQVNIQKPEEPATKWVSTWAVHLEKL